MPWTDYSKTLAAARVAAQRRRQTAKALGLCWRCFPKRHTPAVTTCEACQRARRKNKARSRAVIAAAALRRRQAQLDALTTPELVRRYFSASDTRATQIWLELRRRSRAGDLQARELCEECR